MRHEVPQFIDIEDKIFYWISFRQAVYLVGGLSGAFLVFKLFTYFIPGIPLMIPLALGAPFVALGAALAFVKINQRPFSKFLEAWYWYLISPKRLSWQKKVKKQDKENIEERFRIGSIFQYQQNGQVENNNPVYFADEKLGNIKNKRRKLKDLAYQLDMSDELQEESGYYGSNFEF